MTNNCFPEFQLKKTGKGTVNVTEILTDIKSNITCIRSQPAQGNYKL